MMKRYLGLACCLFLVACATQSHVKKETNKESQNIKGASTSNESANSQLLQKGVEKLKAGSLKDAIESHFDPIINDCQVNYEGKKKLYFGARTPVETIMYAALGGSLKKDTVVLDSTCGDANFFKGFALIDLGQVNEAKVFFEAAINWSPQNSMYLAELGNLYQLKKNWKKSLDYFTQSEEAAVFSPESIKTQELLRAKRGVGYNLTELGRLDEAEEKYRECLAVDKNDKKALSELAYIKNLKNK